MPHVVVLGGGIAGLTAAWTLKQAARSKPLRVTIVEASQRLGGWLHSKRVNGFMFEQGCRGIRPVGSGKEAMRLIESLGLQHQTLVSSDSAKTRYLWYEGRLCKVPTSATEALMSPLTRQAPLWLLRDLAAGPGPALDLVSANKEASSLSASSIDGSDGDESLRSFATRRFGPFVADVLLDAVMSGVYAGDVSALSANSTIPSIVKAGKAHPSGSVVRGLIAQWMQERNAKKRRKAGDEVRAAIEIDDSPFVHACTRASSVSFLDGTQTLANELVRRMSMLPDVHFATGTEVVRLEPVMAGGGGVRSGGAANDNDRAAADQQPSVVVHVSPAPPASGTSTLPPSAADAALVRGRIHADAVISALPASVLARVLPPGGGHALSDGIHAHVTDGGSGCGAAVRALQQIPYASVGVVSMGWKHAGAANNGKSPILGYDGFGYLVPSGQRGPFPPPSAPRGRVEPTNPDSPSAAGGASAAGPNRQQLGTVPVLGMTWDSIVFPGQSDAFVSQRRHWKRAEEPAAPSGHPQLQRPSGYVLPTSADTVSASIKSSETRITVMMGGATWPAITSQSEDDLRAIAMRAVREQAGITGPDPDAVNISVARTAIPQYTVGHAARVNTIQNDVHRAFGGKVLMAGNSFHGVGVADTIASGQQKGSEVARMLSLLV